MPEIPFSPVFTAEGITDVITRMAEFSFQFGLPTALHAVHDDGTATDFSLTFPRPVTAPLHPDGFVAQLGAEAEVLAERLRTARTILARTGEPALVRREGFGRDGWPELTITAAHYHAPVPVDEEDDVDVW